MKVLLPTITAASFYSDFMLNLLLEGGNIQCLSGLKKYQKLSTTDDYHTIRSCGTQKNQILYISVHVSSKIGVAIWVHKNVKSQTYSKYSSVL